MISRRQIRYETRVKRNAGHTLVAFDKKLYLWGGYMEIDEEYIGGWNPNPSHSSDEIWLYEPLFDTWIRKITTGDIPDALTGACAAVHRNDMYLFGGLNNEKGKVDYSCSLRRLNLRTLKWELLEPLGSQPHKCDKSTCWVYENRFYIFGGHGPRVFSSNLHLTRTSIQQDEFGDLTRCWMDQFCYYDIYQNCWVWPRCIGDKASPRAAHAAAVLGHTSYVFGGCHKNKRLNDFYSINLTNHTWTLLSMDCLIAPVPKGRSWHTLNTISEDKLVLYAGLSNDSEVLNDLWIFDASTNKWTERSEIECQFRVWHTVGVPTPGYVVGLGGMTSTSWDLYEPKHHTEDILLVRFTPSTLFMLTMEYMCKNYRDSDQFKSLPKHLRNILSIRVDPSQVHIRHKLFR